MEIDYHPNRFITRKEIQSNPKTLYLFGDNDIKKGYGGQAKEMRGESNSFGISTKKYPNNDLNSFKTDKEFILNTTILLQQFNTLIKIIESGYYNKIVIPPLGNGLAKMHLTAPNTYNFLNNCISNLIIIINNK